MQAITTKYMGPTDFKGGRIKATTEAGKTKTVSYQHELNAEDAHAYAALELARSLGWKGTLVSGAIHGGGYAFVFTSGKHYKI